MLYDSSVTLKKDFKSRLPLEVTISNCKIISRKTGSRRAEFTDKHGKAKA